MGTYEEEYRKYYLDTKSKLKIKSDRNKSEKNFDLKKEEILSLDVSNDIYPKTKYRDDYDTVYNNKNINYRIKEYEKENYKTEECFGGTYKGLESYTGLSDYNGISNYNNLDNYRNFDGGSGRSYYGNVGVKKINGSLQEKTIIEKWTNRFIIKLLLTMVLFVFIIGFKFSPYEKTKVIYTNFKNLVNTNFEYEEFMKEAIAVDVMKEINNIKDNIKIKAEEVNSFEDESNDENTYEVNLDNSLEEIN